MPEGDTVWRACQRLNAVLAGHTLTRTEFRVPALATTDLAGVAVSAVVSRGKHQLFRLENGYTLHSHFRMDGAWRIYLRGQKWTGGPAFQIRAVLSTEEHDVIGYQLPVRAAAHRRRGRGGRTPGPGSPRSRLGGRRRARPDPQPATTHDR